MLSVTRQVLSLAKSARVSPALKYLTAVGLTSRLVLAQVSEMLLLTITILILTV